MKKQTIVATGSCVGKTQLRQDIYTCVLCLIIQTSKHFQFSISMEAHINITDIILSQLNENEFPQQTNNRPSITCSCEIQMFSVQTVLSLHTNKQVQGYKSKLIFGNEGLL